MGSQPQWLSSDAIERTALARLSRAPQPHWIMWKMAGDFPPGFIKGASSRFPSVWPQVCAVYQRARF